MIGIQFALVELFLDGCSRSDAAAILGVSYQSVKKQAGKMAGCIGRVLATLSVQG